MRQPQGIQRLVPVFQARAVQGLARWCLQQPDASRRRAARQLADQRQGAAVRRAARVDGDGQARRREATELVEQALAVKPRSGNDLSIFMRLLGLAFSQSQGHLRKYLEEVYGKVFRRYMLLVHDAAPRIPPLELFWRVHFMLGAAAFSMSGIKALRAMSETDFGVNTSIEQVMRMMVPFLAAGMRSETGVNDPALATAQLKPRSKTPGTVPKV